MFYARKLLAAVVSFFVTLVIGFILFQLMPADPVRTLTHGRPTSDAQMEQLRHSLGLDQPVWQRFINFVNDTLHGRLGFSWQFQEPVSTLIASHFWPTVLLMGTATIISVPLGLWLGIRSGWKHGGLFDRVSSGVSLALWTVPTFWLGLLLLVAFSAGFGPIPSLFPAEGMNDPSVTGGGWPQIVDVARHLVLPAATIVLGDYALYVSIMRSSLIDEMGTPYLLTARAKGLFDADVRRKHAVPNALLPAVTVIFLQIGGIIGGAVTVETVYSWPGLGYLTYQALKVPDLPLLQGTFIVFAASVIVMNFAADVLYRFLDPRVRAQ
jgi:peptide/nickel transport system permease protein